MKKIGILCIAILIIGFGLGRITRSSDHHDHTGNSSGTVEEKPVTWTCSMHPQIKLPKSGKCPICFMDLIPLDSSEGGDEEISLKMTESSMKLAEIETKKVERKEAFVLMSMIGKVAVDSTRILDVSLLADGEIRKLFVNYDGVPVKKGDHLAEIYSPEVYSTGQDYLLALQSESIDSDLIDSAVTKLKLLGVPNDYMDEIKKHKKVPETYILKSLRSGYVKNLIGYQGMWVKKGQMLCRVLDMSSVWVLLDAYESNLMWIRYGQNVTIRAKAIPGEEFQGVVSYIPPELDDQSRTIKVRVNVKNSNGLLKAKMFISAELKIKVTASGRARASKLKGKWISPMHPEIVKDGPGECDVCGMKLVRAEKMGYQYDDNEGLPLMLPASSVLITGKRAVVYVKTSNETPTFEGREVKLGPKAGNDYVVLSGLEEGERVVVKGNFKIDSALQIQAKPSMMSIEGGESLLTKEKEPNKLSKIDKKALRDSLNDFIDYYFEIQNKLIIDKFDGVIVLTADMLGELEYADYSELNKQELQAWNETQEIVISALTHLKETESIEAYREKFKLVSKIIIGVVNKIGHTKSKIYSMYCSMADGHWMQIQKDIKNPYYGESMLRCGEVKKEIDPNHKKK